MSRQLCKQNTKTNMQTNYSDYICPIFAHIFPRWGRSIFAHIGIELIVYLVLYYIIHAIVKYIIIMASFASMYLCSDLNHTSFSTTSYTLLSSILSSSFPSVYLCSHYHTSFSTTSYTPLSSILSSSFPSVYLCSRYHTSFSTQSYTLF